MAEGEPPGNPFGFVDHAAFGGFGVGLVWGKDPDGNEVYIADARRGLACSCVCPACDKPLVARKGKKVAAHFAHRGSGTGCGYGRETNAHMWAKKVLIACRAIWTPPVYAVVGAERRLESRAKWMSFVGVRSERRVGDVVPDIVVTLKNGRELIVEISVTHACGDDKIASLQGHQWPAIEVDLHHLRTCQDIGKVEEALLRTAPREWLCNPRRDRAEKALREELDAKTKKAAAEVQRRVDRDQRAAEKANQKIAKKAVALIKAATALQAMPPCPVDGRLKQLIGDKRSDLVGFRTGGDGFVVPDFVWQASLADRFILVEDIRSFNFASFDRYDAVEHLRAMIAADFLMPPDPEVRVWIAERLPTFRFPDEAVDAYLEELCRQGYIQRTGLGSYETADDRVEQIEAAQARLRALDGRTETVNALIDQIIADLPAAETYDFDVTVWRGQPLTKCSGSADAVIEAGGASYHHFVADLVAVAAMVAGGEDRVDEGLGLPLAGAQRRAEGRRSTRLEAEAGRRAAKLDKAAGAFSGFDAETWLGAEHTDLGGVPLALARQSEAGLLAGLAALRDIEHQLLQETTAVAATAVRRKQLLDEAERLYPPELRTMIVDNYSRDLDQSPWDACQTDQGLMAAQVYLRHHAPSAGKRRR